MVGQSLCAAIWQRRLRLKQTLTIPRTFYDRSLHSRHSRQSHYLGQVELTHRGRSELSLRLRHCRLWRNQAGQKRSFLSQVVPSPESFKNLVPQTLGKTAFDFVTFLATT